jgi:hypothetical protein
MTTLSRAAATQLIGAVFETETAAEAVYCDCPCSTLEHRSDQVCRITIGPGDELKVARIEGSNRRPIRVCVPCWEALATSRSPEEGS